jgi:hypothetical protein
MSTLPMSMPYGGMPNLLPGAGDDTPNGESYPQIDRWYPGSEAHQREVHNDLVQLLHVCRSNGLNHHETAYAITKMLATELAVATAAERWGETPAGHIDMTPELGLLTAALREMTTKRRQRKCQHAVLPGDHRCYLCGSHPWVSRLAFLEHVMDLAVTVNRWWQREEPTDDN